MTPKDIHCVYLYLFSPLHTGGATQEGNLVGIARESHTDLPYIPSSTIRGKLRASESNKETRKNLFGTEIEDGGQLEQGSIWVGDGSILWLPVPSLSHGVVWITSPMLLRRWARLQEGKTLMSSIPAPYSTNFEVQSAVYLKDAILKQKDLQHNERLDDFIPKHTDANIDRAIVLPDRHCSTLVQMGLWRQVKVKLDDTKTVEGGFRYEEAIPPDTMMFFPWGLVAQAGGKSSDPAPFNDLLKSLSLVQIGGQESLGRGFVSLQTQLGGDRHDR